MSSKTTTSPKMMSTTPTAQVLDIDTSDVKGAIPMPPDTFALAQWLGVSHKILWWMILNRKSLYDRPIRIPKPDGRVRIINPPKAQMKYLQRMAVWRIFNKFKTPEHLGAYTLKRGVKYTAGRHAGHKVIIELDIQDFFGSTRRVQVRRFFKDALGWSREVAHAFADLLTYPVNENLSVVPQGAPTSPALCNLIGHELFDKKILAHLAGTDKNWVYTRYSDNLIISHPEQRSREEVDGIKRFCFTVLRDAGYRVHPRKQKVMRATHKKKRQELLGLTVNETPNIPRDEYRRLKAMVHTAETQGVEAVKGTPAKAGVIPHLEGVLNYYLYVNPTSSKMQRLKARVDALKAKRTVSFKMTNGVIAGPAAA